MCLFLPCAWAAIREGEARRGSARVVIRGACTYCRALRVTTRLALHARTPCHMRRCPAWLAVCLSVSPTGSPLINSQGLSAGRSGADSWMRRSGMPRYSVRASCSGEKKKGRGVGLGACGLLQFLHVGLKDCMCICYSMTVRYTTWMQLCRGGAKKSGAPGKKKLTAAK